MTAPTDEPRGPSPHRARFRPAWVVAWLAVALVAGTVLAVLWFSHARVEVLAVVAAAVAFAVSVVLYHLVVTQDVGEHEVARSPGPRLGGMPGAVGRRTVIGGVAGAALALLVGAVGLRRFGPQPSRGSEWVAGRRLVTVTGAPIRPGDIPLGGVVTVWPESAAGTERSAVMVIRLRDEPLVPTRLDGVVDETLVAYSRLCTHAGCAVALYRDRDQALFCPCHQATFDARRGAVPTGGPASIPLPQLPLGVDGAGNLIAAGDLTRPPGPVGAEVRP